MRPQSWGTRLCCSWGTWYGSKLIQLETLECLSLPGDSCACFPSCTSPTPWLDAPLSQSPGRQFPFRPTLFLLNSRQALCLLSPRVTSVLLLRSAIILRMVQLYVQLVLSMLSLNSWDTRFLLFELWNQYDFTYTSISVFNSSSLMLEEDVGGKILHSICGFFWHSQQVG